jgi:SAM-dependent methyltransferase
VHQASIEIMRGFVDRYVSPPCSVVDVGSCESVGRIPCKPTTFRPLFDGCQYEGIDIEPGPNVDRVVLPYDYGLEVYDVVISGSTMEHVEDLHAWSKEVLRICKPGGLLCIIAPHTWDEHPHPVDCWRILPDGMRWLFRDADILDCGKGDTDTYIIARKCA